MKKINNGIHSNEKNRFTNCIKVVLSIGLLKFFRWCCCHIVQFAFARFRLLSQFKLDPTFAEKPLSFSLSLSVPTFRFEQCKYLICAGRSTTRILCIHEINKKWPIPSEQCHFSDGTIFISYHFWRDVYLCACVWVRFGWDLCDVFCEVLFQTKTSWNVKSLSAWFVVRAAYTHTHTRWCLWIRN